MSVSPQIGKENSPFVGVVVICNDKKYCIPLKSPKPKHQTMKKMTNLIGVTINLM